MTANATLARPYSKAAFEYALQHKQVAEWGEMLHAAATEMLGFAKNAQPNLQGMTKQAVSHFENFLQLLGTNRRLKVLPEIAALYEHYRAEHEKRVDIKVTSAFPLDAHEKKSLEAALKTRLQRDVVLQCDVDPHLLGGAVIRIGDQVIDGSVRCALTRLGEILWRN
jgi:F-type H+-transporting ATPase subunit delta